jgi:DNA-binding MarR family transcriptional regulator
MWENTSVTHIEDALLAMTRFGQAIRDDAVGVLGSDDLVSNVSIATLMLLYRDGPQRPTQIAELTGLTSGGAAKLITRLEKAGLVVREAGTVPSAGRAIVVSLTGSGSQKVEEAIAVVAPHVEAMIDALVALRADA